MIYISLLLLSIIAFGLSFGSCLALRRLAPKLGLIDFSGKEERKDHHGNPSLVGGAAIVLSAIIVSTIWFISPLDNITPLLWGMALYVALGMWDDAKNIPALTKLSMQVLISAGVIYLFDFALHNLGHLSGNDVFSLGDLASVFTLICILAYINAFNMIDGIDGLSGGVAVSTFIFLWLIAFTAELIQLQDILLILTMATLGFLVLNMRSPLRRKALIFLGDGGSLSISFAIAYCAVSLGNEYSANTALPSPIIYAFILGYPIFDMLVVMAKRFSKGLSIFAADTSHFHHLLKVRGIKIPLVPMILIGLSAFYSIAGLLLWKFDVSQNLCLVIWFALLALHYYATRLTEQKNYRNQ